MYDKSSNLRIKESLLSNFSIQSNISGNSELVSLDISTSIDNYEVYPFYLMKITKKGVYVLFSDNAKYKIIRTNFEVSKEASQVIYKDTLIITGGMNGQNNPMNNLYQVILSGNNLHFNELTPFKNARYNHCSCIVDNIL